MVLSYQSGRAKNKAVLAGDYGPKEFPKTLGKIASVFIN